MPIAYWAIKNSAAVISYGRKFAHCELTLYNNDMIRYDTRIRYSSTFIEKLMGIYPLRPTDSLLPYGYNYKASCALCRSGLSVRVPGCQELQMTT